MSLSMPGVWAPSPKDLVADFAPQQLIYRTTAGAAATTVAVTSALQIPFDKVLVLRSLLIEADPGVAQNYTYLTAFLIESNVQLASLLSGKPDTPTPLAANPAGMLWTGEIAMLFGQEIQCTGLFDAGAATNTVVINAVGYYLPRGNFRR